jgi:hypothetical protein
LNTPPRFVGTPVSLVVAAAPIATEIYVSNSLTAAKPVGADREHHVLDTFLEGLEGAAIWLPKSLFRPRASMRLHLYLAAFSIKR